MSHHDDRDYFCARADQEYDIGDRAANPRIAAIHYELAYRYALRSTEVGCDVIPLMLRRA